MKNTLKTWVRRIKGNEKGVAALLAVVLAIVVIGTIAFSFLAQTEQKSSGSALTYTSTNAYLVAEAGLRFAEKCLTSATDQGCPCAGNCNDWGNLVDSGTGLGDFASPISFGDSRGQFEISFDINQQSSADSDMRVTATGTFAGAERAVSKNLFKACKLAENAITACSDLTLTQSGKIDPSDSPTEEGEAQGACDVPAVPTIEFPVEMTCPGSTPDFSHTSPTGTGTPASPYQFCDWTQTTGTVNVGTEGQTTEIWVKQDFVQSGGTLNIFGDVSINVGGKTTLASGSGKIVLAAGSTSDLDATLTIQTQTPAKAVTTVEAASGQDLVVVDDNTDFIGGETVDIRDFTDPLDILSEENTISSVVDSTDLDMLNNLVNTYAIGSKVQDLETGDFTMDQKFEVNKDGDPANVIVLIGGDGALNNNIVFFGALYGENLTLDLQQKANVTGSIVGDNITLSNNTTLTYDETAGQNSEGYSVCEGSTGAAVFSEG